MMDYQVKLNGGLININTLSPNKKYFYKVRPPKELNKSAYGCSIAFYDVYENLIYHRRNTFAHEIHSINEQAYLKKMLEKDSRELHLVESVIKLVNWSEQGNVCYFLEYLDNGIEKEYDSVFLDCKNICFYRINENIDKWEFVNSNNIIDTNFNEEVILQKLSEKKISPDKAVQNSMQKGLFSFLKKNHWYP